MMMRRLRRDERGATAIEYGLIAALIAAACVGAFSAMGGGSTGMWTQISGSVVTAMSGAGAS
jgi:pilus assembly protein Flp/PilA